jgi:hypothetical protein
MRRGKDEGGAQEGRYPMSGAEKYARICREVQSWEPGRRTRTDHGLGPLPRRKSVLAHSLIFACFDLIHSTIS